LKKYLIIRFSSIGDIVLTSPIIRCIKKQQPEVTLHYLTKSAFGFILKTNNYVDKVYTINNDISEVIKELKAENYDLVIDLHKNLRTFRLKQKLKCKSVSFPKLNFQKFLLTTFKIRKMPDVHIVSRYFKTVETFGITNDQQGLDYFLTESDIINITDYGIKEPYIAFAIGAQFATKKLPKEKIVELLSKVEKQVVLLGGSGDEEAGIFIANNCKNSINLCGKLSLNQSASVVQQAEKVISHDTGLMHIASAFNKPIISIWGNTVPELGMYPYQPKKPTNYTIHQVDISCRPCSKIGYQKCPKKHFNCMVKQNLTEIAEKINQNAN